MRKALIVYGGWDGHEPEAGSHKFAEGLKQRGFDVTLSDDLETYNDADLGRYDLIVPNVTMSSISGDQLKGLCEAVRAGSGLAGAHGGMCDSFRGSIEYQWMTGGQFLGHPHVGEYTVCLTGEASPVTEGMPKSWVYDSEQYYMMVDPGARVLADTVYEHDGYTTRMPVMWTRTWGKGRVFYSSLGHKPAEYDKWPHVLEMLLRGMEWAARD